MVFKAHVQAVFQYVESCAKWPSHCFDKTRFHVPKMLGKVLPKRACENLEIGSKLNRWKLPALSHWKLLRKSSLNMLFHHMFTVPAEPVCSLWFCGSKYREVPSKQQDWKPITSILRGYSSYCMFLFCLVPCTLIFNGFWGPKECVLFCTVQIRIFGAHLSDTLSCFPILQAGCFYSPTGLSLKDMNVYSLHQTPPNFHQSNFHVCSRNFKVEI